MTEELRKDCHATRRNASTHFAERPQGQIGEAPRCVVLAGLDEPYGAYNAHDAAEDREEGGRKHG